MAAVQENHESLKERARRVLLDNSSDHQPTYQAPGPVQQGGETSQYTEELALRLQAIQLIRDMGPKRACCGERVRSLSKTLAEIPGDSVHYRNVLDKLREAHQEWLELEETLWDATHVLRSTQWLVDLLSDPVAVGESSHRGATG